jgi:hypothetical protein
MNHKLILFIACFYTSTKILSSEHERPLTPRATAILSQLRNGINMYIPLIVEFSMTPVLPQDLPEYQEYLRKLNDDIKLLRTHATRLQFGRLNDEEKRALFDGVSPLIQSISANHEAINAIIQKSKNSRS